MAAIKYTREDINYLLTVAYLDARRNERHRQAQLEFELNLETNIKDLREAIFKRTYKPQPPYCFLIDTPREVFAPQFRDRVVSHFIFNMLYPLFDPLLIYDSYSCRKGKGTLFGIERLERHLRSCTENYTKRGYVLCLDISGYFMSIDRQRLYDILWKDLNRNKAKWESQIDYDVLDFLLRAFLFRDPTEGCTKLGDLRGWDKLPSYKSLFNCKPGIGLMIGDVTSQLFSNIYLNHIDHYAKEMLGCKRYGRYVDDIRIVDRDKKKLEWVAVEIGKELETSLGLKLNPKKTRIIKTTKTIDFLGAELRRGKRYASKKTIKRFAKKVAGMGEDIEEDVVNSYLGYLSHFRANKGRDKVIKKNQTIE